MEPEEIQKMLVDDALEIYKENEELLPEETIREMERVYLLKNVDTHWMDHIDNMDQLRAGGAVSCGARVPVRILSTRLSVRARKSAETIPVRVAAVKSTRSAAAEIFNMFA